MSKYLQEILNQKSTNAAKLGKKGHERFHSDRNQKLSEGALIWRDPGGPVATATCSCDILAFSFMLGWNPSGDSGLNATRRRAKTFKCSQARWPPRSPPWGGGADGQVGFWEFAGDTGRLFLPLVYRHSMHLQPRGTRAKPPAASGTGCTCPSCPLMCAAATGQQGVFLFTAWSHAKHVEIHAVKPEGAFRAVLSHLHSLQVKSAGVAVTF